MKGNLKSLAGKTQAHITKIVCFCKQASPQQKGILFFLGCVVVFLIFRSQRQDNNIDLSNTLIQPDIETTCAIDIDRTLYTVGQTKASRVVSITPETSGKVKEIVAKKGLFLKKDDVILRIEGRNQSELLDQAKARLQQKELEFKGAEKLSAKGFKSETSELQVKAELEAAKAELASAQREYDKLTIRAPYECYLETLSIEKGDVVSPQSPIGKITDLTSIEAHFNLSEENIHKITPESEVQVKIKGIDKSFTGHIQYLSKSADSKTRTYGIEVLLDNPDHTKIFDGQTCEANIISEKIKGYILPLSSVNLDENGVVGIKVIDNNVVRFLPITIIEIKEDKVIVMGLPDKISLIRYGGDFINDGEKISALPDENDKNALKTETGH